ncbi:Exc2 family lipoprotein [Pseudomonas graminis]
MSRLVTVGLTLALTGILSGCNNPVSSPQAHAKSYVFKAKDDFDPNFTTQVANTIKLMTPVFAQFYEQGKQDRKAGLSQHEAEKKATAMYQDQQLNNLVTNETFISHTTSTPADKKRNKIFIREASGAYLDGFNGR